MFDFVRKHTKLMMSLMFLLIIPAFVLVGINGFKDSNGAGETVAKVGSHEIKQAEWDAAHKAQIERLRASRPNLDPKLLDSPQARYVTLERLVREKLLFDAVADNHMTTTDARLARELQTDPTIASLRKADGTLDMERYRQLAASQGLTPEGYEARVRSDLSIRQVEAGVALTAFPSKVQVDLSLNAFFERREVQIANFQPASYAGKINPTDAEIESFFKENQALFQAPETATIEYVVLDLESVKKTITINEADLKTYFEQNASRLSGKEERRASHILINAAKDASAADKQKAKDRALELLAQLRKSPDSFADVAKKNSQDPGSAANGGDLDFFARGAMVKPFEDAAFQMKKGDISDVVESDFGYHIIKLTDIKAPKQKSYEEVKASIEADLRAQQAQRKYAEVAEVFTNTVYEQSDNLKGVAEKLKLEVKTASQIRRTPAAGATGVLANPKLLAAIFSPDSIEKKRNTEALELGNSQLVSARITEYKAAHTLPLSDVRNDVRNILVASKSSEMAKKEGADKLNAWKSQPDPAGLGPVQTVSRDGSQSISPVVRDAALRADASALPAWVGVDLGRQGYAIVRVNKVLPRTAPDEATAKQERLQVNQWLANAENSAYLEMLKSRYKVQMKVPKPASLPDAIQ